MFERYDIEHLYLAFIPGYEDEYTILYQVNGRFTDFKKPKCIIDLDSVEYMKSYSSYFVYAENKDKIVLNKKQVLEVADEHYKEFVMELEEFRNEEDKNLCY